LLERFPPPSLRGNARAPAIVGAPPPLIARSRFGLQADARRSTPAVPLTYEPFYGFSEAPFGLSTDPKFVYHTTSHDRALQELVDALGRGNAVVLLSGDRGTGKRTLCRSLVGQLGRRVTTSIITDPGGSIEGFLKRVLTDFGAVSREEEARGRFAGATRHQLSAAIGDFAASLAPMDASALIIIVDAEHVANDIFEALAALVDAPAADRRVQIILTGGPSLPSILHRKELRALERCVSVRCRLDPLTADEVGSYVAHRLEAAGTGGRVRFDEGAVLRLHRVTGGVPRLINLVCDAALTRAHEASASVIDDRSIAAAAGDLGIERPRSGARRMLQTVGVALMYVGLMLAGASAAAWLFRGQLARMLR
jgi:general secretion pathway protein A